MQIDANLMHNLVGILHVSHLFKIEEGNDYLQNQVNSIVFSLSQIKNKVLMALE